MFFSRYIEISQKIQNIFKRAKTLWILLSLNEKVFEVISFGAISVYIRNLFIFLFPIFYPFLTTCKIKFGLFKTTGTIEIWFIHPLTYCPPSKLQQSFNISTITLLQN